MGQTITMTANPLDPLAVSEQLWNKIEKLINEWRPDALVVGIPLNMDGTPQTITHKAREFANILREKFNLMVHQVDERLTTVSAKEKLYELGGYKALKKISIDSFAAKLILESWMNIQV